VEVPRDSPARQLSRGDEYRHESELDKFGCTTRSEQGARTTTAARAKDDHDRILLVGDCGQAIGYFADLSAWLCTAVGDLVIEDARGDALGGRADLGTPVEHVDRHQASAEIVR
jgi:hypothetical protein